MQSFIEQIATFTDSPAGEVLYRIAPESVALSFSDAAHSAWGKFPLNSLEITAAATVLGIMSRHAPDATKVRAAIAVAKVFRAEAGTIAARRRVEAEYAGNG